MLELLGGDAVHPFQVAHGDDDGRLADDPVAAVDDLAELRQRLQAVSRVGLLCGLPRRLRLLFSDNAVFFAFFFDLPLLAPAKLSIAAISVASDRWAYQTSIVDISANSAIASR